VMITTGYDCELILVNDGSIDKTWEIISKLASKEPRILGINLVRNFGQHNALLCGIGFAKFDMCVTLDDDLQYLPEDIPKLIGKLDEGFDVVYGVPIVSCHGLARNFISFMARWAGSVIFGIEKARILSAFRAFRTELTSSFDHLQGHFVSIDSMLSWNTSNFGHIRVRHDWRRVEKSNYNFKKLLILSLTMLFGFNFRKYIHNSGKTSYVIQQTTGINNYKYDKGGSS
ncbi:MAG: glycosyltransferase, partial [Desulfomonilaceae bacterium]